jgi:hypothetical protein
MLDRHQGRHLDSNYPRHHDASMRTTLTLDQDVADFLKEQARLLNKPFKQVVNETLRRGMSPTLEPTERRRFKVKPISSGFNPGIDPLKIKELDAELEVEEFLRKNPNW